MSNQKINNHLLPRLIIKKWENKNGKLFDKSNNEIRKIHKHDFSEKNYYSLGKEDNILENRISKFENVIAPILKKIDDSNESIDLSGKELELLKLFCVLVACRQENTSSVIKSDESGVYRNNNYIFGIPLLKTQEQCIEITNKIMDDFEKINKLSNDAIFENQYNVFKPEKNSSFFTFGQHLVILRNEKETNLISDICAIIECNIDSNYLFTYIPISPKTSLALVKTKYYDNPLKYQETLQIFSNLYNFGMPDQSLSVIFDNRDYVLFNSNHSYINSSSDKEENTSEVKSYSKVKLKIQNINPDEVRQFNSIICEDGKKIIYTNKEEFIRSKENKLDIRHITFIPFL